MTKTEKILLLLAALGTALVLVIRPGQPEPLSVEERFTAPVVEKVTPVEVVIAEHIDLNTADADALTALPGVGKVTAERIVAYREEHGPFGCLEDLLQVDGVKPSVLEKIYDAMAENETK